jgi:4-hydroxy-2-oxoheptanedioate aldolase
MSEQIPGVTDITPNDETIFSLANKHTAIIPQIESKIGIENLESILAVKEISAFMLGRACFRSGSIRAHAKTLVVGDLRLDMGLSLGFTGDEPEFVRALQKAKGLSKERDIALLGAAIGKEMVKKRLDEGYRILVCCLDCQAFAFGVMSALGEAREVVEEHMQSIHTEV